MSEHTHYTHPHYQTRKLHVALAAIMLLLVPVACNLGTSQSSPPTLQPRPSATPAPTLGFSGVGGGIGGGVQPTIIPNDIESPVSSTELEVFNLINRIEGDRMMAHIRAMEGFYTRHVNSNLSSDGQGIGAARKYIWEQLELIQQTSNGRLVPFKHEFSMTYSGVSSTQENLVAYITGTQPGASTVVIGAHYDSIGPDFNDGTVFAPGANDNGSGVAALIELARVLSQRQHRSTIMFVFFSAEEVGRVGSKRFVEYLVDRNIDLVGMINVDGIGNANDRNGNIIRDELRVFSDGPNDASASRHMARTAEFLSFMHGMNMKLIVEDAIDRENRYGDHFSFSEANYPAIRFISALEEWPNASTSDLIDAVEQDYLTRAAQSILMVITAMADGPLPPSNISLRDRPDGTSELVWNPVPSARGYVVALRRAGSLRYDKFIEVREPQAVWDGFRDYSGIAIAAKDGTGIVGRLSSEYVVR